MYHSGLDHDAQHVARLTGIAIGWDSHNRFVCGCEVCHLIVVDWYGTGQCGVEPYNVVLADALEANVIQRFEQQALSMGCQHYLAYLALGGSWIGNSMTGAYAQSGSLK